MLLKPLFVVVSALILILFLLEFAADFLQTLFLKYLLDLRTHRAQLLVLVHLVAVEL